MKRRYERKDASGKLREGRFLRKAAAVACASMMAATATMTVCAEETAQMQADVPGMAAPTQVDVPGMAAQTQIGVPGMAAPGQTAAPEAAEITAASRAIVAYSEDFTMGTVASLCNGVTFQNCVYAGNYDSIVVSAYPNSGYSFAYFTDNGVIVTKSSYYAFNPGYYDHTVVAHFVKRDDNDDDDVPRVNWSNSACVYAPGYKIDAVSITTNQVVQGKLCREAFDSVLEDYHYIGMYNISFAHAGKPVEKLSGSVQLLFDIPAQYQKAGRSFRMLRVYQGQPVVLEDLNERGNKVQFETDCTAAYALVYKD